MADLPHGLDQHVLADLLGLGVVAQTPVHGQIHGALVTLGQPAKRLPVAALCRANGFSHRIVYVHPCRGRVFESEIMVRAPTKRNGDNTRETQGGQAAEGKGCNERAFSRRPGHWARMGFRANRQTRFQAAWPGRSRERLYGFAPNPNGAQRRKRVRACNSAGTPRIATPTTTLLKQNTLRETEFIVPVLEM